MVRKRTLIVAAVVVAAVALPAALASARPANRDRGLVAKFPDSQTVHEPRLPELLLHRCTHPEMTAESTERDAPRHELRLQ
jgi:hypothetical protein